jgi:RNA polymerase sigma-70 factor (ECF subfamily)
MKPSNEELLGKVAGGDRQAFSLLYDRLAPRAFGLCLHFLRIHADAEDVLQETFLQVWDQASKFDPSRCAAAGWVLMIARSRALDRLRRRQMPAPLPESLPASDASRGAELELRESLKSIADVLVDLPAEQIEVIRLAFYVGLTHEKIATRLGLPLGTVKTRIRLGMIRLRERLNSSNKATDE